MEYQAGSVTNNKKYISFYSDSTIKDRGTLEILALRNLI